MKEAGVSLFGPNLVTNDSNMRNGMNTRAVQLGQYVSARSDIWKSARKILVLLSSCSSSRSRGLAHADECACAYYVQLCAFVKRISEDRCDQTEEAESCSLVLVCSICTFDILSCLWKEYSYSAFPCILILVMAEKRLKQHVDHRGMLNPPTETPNIRSFRFRSEEKLRDASVHLQVE